jgi:osmotically-inducible protein OsmY
MKFTPRTWLLRSLVAATLCGSLGACAPLLVGSAVMGGTLVITDRRTSGAQLEDEGIELRGLSRLQNAIGDRGHVNITSYNRQVLLTGEVPSEKDKQTVEQVLSRVENVRGIVNELGVMGTSSLTQRSSDVLISARIKASFVDTKDLSANSFKVVTERGTVYLMGRVTQTEGTRAAEVVRSIPGVQKVVRIFEYLSDEELRQYLPRPPAKSP